MRPDDKLQQTRWSEYPGARKRLPRLTHTDNARKAQSATAWMPLRPAGKVVCYSKGERDAYRILKVPPNSSKARIRQAYLEQIKLCHPDVSMDEAANDLAVSLNVAYEELMQVRRTNSESEDDQDIFDFPEAEPSCLFIDPFACNIDPMSWKAVQEAVTGTDDPIGDLAKLGVFAGESAVYYLSPGQLECIIQELEAMEESFAVEATAWTLAYRLGRARTANKKF